MTKQQRVVLIVSILASFVAFLDTAIVNVALPAIQAELGGGLSAQQWIVDSYFLMLGALILIAGSLSDLLGRKKILMLGLWGFAAASVLCAVAPNNGILILFRAVQGITAALIVPSSLALIISTFSGTAQGKAIGSWTAWTGIAFILGPLLGGILVDTASWRWIFGINVLPIAVTLYLLKDVQIKNEGDSKARVDYRGALLCAAGLGGPVFALIEQPRYGWGSPLIYLPLITGIILLAIFMWYEKRATHPMLPLSLFRNHNFSVGNVATLLVYAGLAAALFLLVLFLQQVANYSALAAGLASVPVTVSLFLLSSRFGALSAKYGPRLFMGMGPIVAALGFLLMLNLGAEVNYWTDLFPAIVLFGLGLSITVAPLTAAILGDVASAQAGIASAVNNAVARIAGLVAIAAVGAIVAAQFSSAVDQKLANTSISQESLTAAKHVTLQTEPPKPFQSDPVFREALTDASVSAFHTGILAIAALMIAGGLTSLVGIRNPVKD